MIVIYGSSGFIGRHLIKYLSTIKDIHFMCSKTRIWDYKNIEEELKLFRPTAVINMAGYPTPTNIDFYEESTENKSNLLLTNTTGNIVLADICNKFKIHLITLMSGCIFDSTEKNTIFSDDDTPNFFGSLYSRNRIVTEGLLSIYSNICIVRIRMPVSSYMHKKSLINKLISYEEITNCPNSITVLDDCMPKFLDLLKTKKTGIVNLVNSGTITNAHICYMYKLFVNPNHKFKIVTTDYLESKNKEKPKRSNCIIQPSVFFGDMPDVKESIVNIFKKFKRTKDIYC